MAPHKPSTGHTRGQLGVLGSPLEGCVCVGRDSYGGGNSSMSHSFLEVRTEGGGKGRGDVERGEDSRLLGF